MADDITEKTVSNLVEQQFPEFYLTEGPTFVQFVKTYYQWLEGSQEVSVPFAKGRVSFSAGNNTITGINTFFVDQFLPGDKIGLFYDDTDDNYQIFTVEDVASDISLTLDDTFPLTYSSNSSLYGIVKVEQNPNYHIRRLNEYSDVDTTIDDFIVFFKEKYLKNIQFTTKTNTRQLIKHALDLYRAKGTPQGLALLFRLVFGVNVSLYYPGTDVFKLSDGQWFVPRYLELALRDATPQFVNKQIVGLNSGATAFVESVIRRSVKGRLVDIAYISSIRGNFETNEFINLSVNPIALEDCPAIIGSLGSIEIATIGTGINYAIGDTVDVFSDHGEQAKARVSDVSDVAGIVEFTLEDGGYGYTANAQILISEKILQVNNLVVTNTAVIGVGKYFEVFDTITQPLAQIAYVHANNSFVANTPLYAYYSNGSPSGNGFILSANVTNSSVGSLLVALYSGNLNTSYIGTTGNAITANIGTYTDKTATGNAIGHYANCKMKVSNASVSDFGPGTVIYQQNSITLNITANGTISRYITDFGTNSYFAVINTFGAFDPSQNVMVQGSPTVNCAITALSLGIGVINITNDFYDLNGAFIQDTAANLTANVLTVSSGSGATYALSNSFNYVENVSLNTDLLSGYLSTLLNANTYGFPGNTSANLSTIMDQALTYSNVAIGKLTAIKGAAVGEDYDLAPITKVFEPLTYPYMDRSYWYLNITGATGQFKVGELVTQSGVNSRGLVKSANSTCVYVEMLRLLPNNFFVVTSNSTTVLTGTDTTFTANVTTVGANEGSDFIGLDAEIDAEAISATGAITALDITDSGVGFYDGEIVNFGNANNDATGIGHAVVNKVGKAAGFYKQKGGLLSDTKKLFDGLYYQDYSYEIRSSVTLDKYEDMLKKIMHIPGTKYFGAFVYDTVNETPITAKSTIVTQS